MSGRLGRTVLIENAASGRYPRAFATSAFLLNFFGRQEWFAARQTTREDARLSVMRSGRQKT
jgi:hypothetical protein